MASEIDKFANQAYELLYGMETVGDITKVKAEDVPDHDLLTAGFPCQAFSVAGKRLGFEDTRGTLFFEVARIANVKQPKVILLENVKGLINHGKGKTLNTIIQTLCDIGYTVDFEVLNSKYFGVPQNRERIFIVAVRDDLITPKPWKNTKGNTVVPKGKRRIQKLDGVKTFNFDYPEQVEVTKRLRDILEYNVDERFYLSEEKTAKLIEQLNEGAGLGKDGELGTIVNGDNISPTIDANYAKGIGPSDVTKNRNRRPMLMEPRMLGFLNIKGNESIRRVYSAAGVSPTLTTCGGGNTEPKVVVTSEEVRPVLTPDRLEKRQNGRRFKEAGEEMFTLTSQDRHGVLLTKNHSSEEYEIPNWLPDPDDITKVKYLVRKLTPLECFRLQAFPDEYYEILSANGISNTQLYKMAGNAVTVSVIDAIGKRLIPYLTTNKEVIAYQPAQTNYTNTPLITP